MISTPQHLARFADAARLARDAQLPGEHEALFGLVMQSLPTVLEALIAQAPETLRLALERAIADNVIGTSVAPRITEIIEALQAVIVRLALRDPTPEQPSFASLFELAGTPQRHRTAVLTEYVRRTGTVAAFWEQQRRRLGDEAADELEFVVRIAALSMNHEPLVRQLTRMRAGGEIDRDLASLARFSREDWLGLLEREVDGRAIGAPAFLARTDADRTALFATFLARYVEAGSPTRVLTERLASDAHSTLAPAVAFLRRHSTFDFRSNRIGEFLRENPNALDDDTSPDETRASLSAMQRLFDVAPPFDKHRTVALFAEGISSATQIRRLGESAFVERAAASLGGIDAARAVYAKAAHKADTALLLLSQTATMNPTAMKVLPAYLFGLGIPDLENLFGTLDSCRCQHCESVYGPAAYLVDILHFLSNSHSATPGESALDVLFERRPDIGEVDLNCANAETTLPYVDLVMEILENAVAPGVGFPFQTEGEAADLLASPAQLNQAAYDELELAVYPWSLPFELSIETARTYLDHLGVPRHALMQRFRAEADPSKALDVATEYLGLAAALRAILLDPEAASAHALWGLANPGAFNQMVQVANAATVLERSRLSYEELDAALAVRFVDAVGDIDIEFAGAGCDLTTATLTNLTPPALTQLQAFMRVQRKLGWSIEELDAILETLDVAAFDEAALLRLADAKRLQQSLNVPVRVLLAWWQPLLAARGIGSQASLYTELFLDASVNRPEMAIFALNTSGTELLGAEIELVSANLAPIHAALGITAADLDALLPGLPDDALNLANLTRLARPALLAKALHLKLADYLALRALSGIEPIGPLADTATTLRFADVAGWLKQAGYGLPVLDYLLRHRFAANAAFVPAEADIGSFLATLRTALRAINAEFALAAPDVDQSDPGFVADPDGSRTVKHLAALLPAGAVDQAMALIRQDTVHAPADPEAFIETSLGAFLDPAEAAERLLGEGALTTFAARDNYVLGALLAHLGASARTAQVVTAFAAALQVDAPVAAALLGELVHSPADASRLIQDDFTDAGFVGPPDEPTPPVAVDRATFPQQFASYERMAKLVQFARLLGLSDTHVRFVLQRGPELGWVDLTDLPLAVADDAEAGFAAFQRMANALAAGTRLPGGLADFFGLLEALDTPGMDLAHYLDEVSLRTGWNRDDVEFLVGSQLLAVDFPDGFRDGRFLADMEPCMAQLKRLGVAASTAQAWASLSATPDDARTVIQGARARYPDKNAWLKVARPLRDGLRERQRVALVDFLVHREGLQTPSDLYGHFLVDVEMSPCMLTSRMVLATGSVQLFVQRCLLGLESAVPSSAIDIDLWHWMKNYRVWEANRKIFLYPENWIQPELRDDKTPLFKALEQGLLSDELNDATVEHEYLRYLKSLDEIANLEIAGVYQDSPTATQQVLHVFGRSHNAPRNYHYRRWDGTSWTCWELLDIGIEGDHLVPAVWNDRVYLFWPMLFDATQEVDIELEDGSQGTTQKKYQSFRLQWSEYRDGLWSPKSVSTADVAVGSEKFGVVSDPKVYEPADLAFWTKSLGPDAVVLTFAAQKAGTAHQNDSFAHWDLVLQVSGESGRSNTAAPADPGSAFPSLINRYNQMGTDIEFPGTGGKLRVWTRLAGLGADASATTVLGTTPRQPFTVAFHQDERPFFCRTPFFYSDQRRSFLVIPDGRYLSDPDSGSPLGKATGPTPTHGTTPLDLPDQVTAFHVNVARAALAEATGEGETPMAVVPSFLPGHWETTSFRFKNHHHPFVRVLIEQLNRHGNDGILRPRDATEPVVDGAQGMLHRQTLDRTYFRDEYSPAIVENVVRRPLPVDDFDFEFDGAYSTYNWELFFHAPFTIAKRLDANRRFEEAHRWFHYIFEPTNSPSSEAPWPECVWNIKPFYEHGTGRTIEQMMLLLHTSGLNDEQQKQRDSLNKQVEAWRKNPFNPHLIARMRVQPYMMAVVMAYLDHLIAWADDLFRLDTMESVNEASQLYLLAAELLGDRPREIAAHEGTWRTIDGEPVRNFNDLRPHLDTFSNALVDMETILHPGQADQGAGDVGGLLHGLDYKATTAPGSGGLPAIGATVGAAIPALIGPTLFFCIPRNDKLVGYWDIVADRLFKIRHCMNIEGVVRQLALFEPPIDPALLVQAIASGVGIGDALAGLNAPMPSVRFGVLLDKAREVAAQVTGLGAALLAALEKRDAEQLSLLRSGQERRLLESMRLVKTAQLDQLAKERLALDQSRAMTAARLQHYLDLMLPDPETGDTLIEAERTSQEMMLDAIKYEGKAGTWRQAQNDIAKILPDVGLGWAGPAPTTSITVGHSNFVHWVEGKAIEFSNRAAAAHGESNTANLTGTWHRRLEEWMHQASQASLELGHIDALITAADLRTAVANHELDVHDKQIAHAAEIDDYLRAKYTSPDLYGWMISRLSSVYFQAFQLATDLATRAERSFRFELGLPTSSFIQLGHWDSLKKGLLAGESLTLDLARMASAYLEQNKREYELTKHVSLRQLNPLALLELKATGTCEVTLPEWLFDLDGPGHYLRRLKTVSLSIPCVIGPYASVNCTASLLNSSVRTSPILAGGYARDGEDAARFVDYFGAIQSVVTSSGSTDAGMFETNLRDDRYLPFEGSGAIGQWRLELPSEFRQFDYTTISDVILHLRYTAREGGTQLRGEAVGNLSAVLSASNVSGPVLLLSLRNDYPGEWHRFVNGEPLVLAFGRDRFSYIAQGHPLEVQDISLVSLTDAAPVPTELSAEQVGLTAFPTFDVGQSDEASLTFADDLPGLERDPDAHTFLLVRYVIQ